MTTDNEPSKRTGRRMALPVMVAAVAGAACLIGYTVHVMQPPTAIATDCSGFAADAQAFFAKGDAVALSGTFAPGDHLHLAIDLNGTGYAYELKGVMAKKPDLSGSGSYGSTRTVVTTSLPTSTSESQVTESTGAVSGYAKMDMDIDVTAAGTGAIMIRKTGLFSWFASPQVSGASCNNAGPAV